MKSLVRILIFTFAFTSCSSSHENEANLLQIPFSLTGTSSKLELVSVATSVQLSVSGCVSGYTQTTFTLTRSWIPLYQGDRNCLVKMSGFTLGSQAYTNTGTGAVDFTTWLVGNTATFRGASSTDLITVYVISQVTQGGVLGLDFVQYKFTDIAATATSNISQANITFSDSISVTGDAAPAFTMTQARVLSTNANTSFNMSFTLQCTSTLGGSSNPTYTCNSVFLNSSPVQLDYIFIRDTYSQSALTVAQLTAAFGANTATGIGTLTVAPGGTDLHANTLTNGGFYTSDASPLTTGTSSPYPSNLSWVFMLRRRDGTASNNVQSYTYFYVEIPTVNPGVATCGGYFAGGSGTSGSPYQVTDATTLANVSLCTTSTTYFTQLNNIDLTGVSWTPGILYGQYNGGGFSISNLSLTTASAASVDGVFSTINTGATVSSLNLSNINITSQGVNVGALAGVTSGTITNVGVLSGTLNHTFAQANSGSSSVGGLVGNMGAGSSISGSTSAANITSTETATTTGNTYNLGGLVGVSTVPSISSSAATGNVSIASASATARTINMGSLLGSASTGTAGALTQNYATGNLTFPTGGTSTTLTMGMVGKFAPTTGSTLSYSFAKGTFTSSSSSSLTTGGMIGALTLTGAASINNSYTMVTFAISTTTAGNLGGFVGTQSSANVVSLSYSADPSFTTSITTSKAFNGSSNAVTNSYYYNGAAGVPADTSGASGQSSANMQLQGTFSTFTFGTSATNWAMPTANTFSSPSGFLSPVLYWQCGANGISC